MEHEKIRTFAWSIYVVMRRRESDYCNKLDIMIFKCFLVKNVPYKTTEEEFFTLIKVYRKLSTLYPDNIKLDEEIDYNAPLDKSIGTFNTKNLCNNSYKETVDLIDKTVKQVLKNEKSK